MALWLPLLLIALTTLLLFPKWSSFLYRHSVDPASKLPLTPPWFAVWNFLSSKSRTPLNQALWLYRNYGSLYLSYPFPGLFGVEFSNPKLMKEVYSDYNKFPKPKLFDEHSVTQRTLGLSLVTVNGEKWKNQRQAMAPAFKRKFLLNMVPEFVDLSNKIVRDWNKLAGETFPVHDYFLKMTLDAIGNAGFGYDFGALDNKLGPEIQSLDTLLHGFTDLQQQFPVINQIPTAKKKKADEAYKVIWNLLERTIENAKKSDSHDHTILNHILAVSKDSETQLMTHEEMKHNLFLFFIAGHETTASALTSAVFYLSKYPEMQEKLRQEIDKVLGGNPIVAEQVEQMKYLENVIKETLRLRPPVPGHTPRVTTQESDFDGFKVPANVNISSNFAGVMQDEKYFPQSERFWPERWEEPIPSEYFLPFFYGPRICIGKKFAMIEIVVVLATLYQKFETSLISPDYELKDDPYAFSLKPLDGLKVLVQKRKN